MFLFAFVVISFLKNSLKKAILTQGYFTFNIVWLISLEAALFLSHSALNATLLHRTQGMFTFGLDILFQHFPTVIVSDLDCDQQ